MYRKDNSGFLRVKVKPNIIYLQLWLQIFLHIHLQQAFFMSQTEHIRICLCENCKDALYALRVCTITRKLLAKWFSYCLRRIIWSTFGFLYAVWFCHFSPPQVSVSTTTSSNTNSSCSVCPAHAVLRRTDNTLQMNISWNWSCYTTVKYSGRISASVENQSFKLFCIVTSRQPRHPQYFKVNHFKW